MKSVGDDFVLVNGVLVASTPKAILVHSDYMDYPVWMPRSQVQWDTEQGGRNRVVVKVAKWLADKEGIQ